MWLTKPRLAMCSRAAPVCAVLDAAGLGSRPCVLGAGAGAPQYAGCVAEAMPNLWLGPKRVNLTKYSTVNTDGTIRQVRRAPRANRCARCSCTMCRVTTRAPALACFRTCWQPTAILGRSCTSRCTVARCVARLVCMHAGVWLAHMLLDVHRLTRISTTPSKQLWKLVLRAWTWPWAVCLCCDRRR